MFCKSSIIIKPIANSKPAILQVNNLHFAYPHRALFTRFSMQTPPGVSLVKGGDGTGKTTLLRLLAGDLSADAGELQINGVHLSKQPEAYRQQVFWVDPSSTAFDQITPHDYFHSLQSACPQFDTQGLDRLTEGLSLTVHLDKPMYMLSTGSKRKVYLAAAFASGAALILLDNPFAALDRPSIGFVMALLNESTKHPTQAWVVAHYDSLGDLPLVKNIDLGL